MRPLLAALFFVLASGTADARVGQPPTVMPDGRGWEALYRWCRQDILSRHRLSDVKTGRSQHPELTALRHINACFDSGGRVR